MNYTNLIKKLRKISLGRDSAVVDDEDAYYRAFALKLHRFFQERFKGNYLFSFPFISEKGEPKNPLHSYLVSHHLPRHQRKKIQKYFKANEKPESGVSFTLTTLMVEYIIKKKIQSILVKSKSDNSVPIEENEDLKEYLSEFIVIDLRQDLKDTQGKYTENFRKIARQLNVKSNEYKKLYRRLIDFRNIPAPDNFLYLIKPTANHKQFNVVLALGVRCPIPANEFHLLRLLVYRFVSEVAIKELEKIEQLKRKKSFSLTTHAFKTEINTTLIPQVGIIQDLAKPTGIPDLISEIGELDNQCTDLFYLTGIITLIDKIIEEKDFIESGKKDGLIESSKQTIDVSKYCENYNLKNKSLDRIIPQGNTSMILNIKIYGEYLSERVIKLFYNMIFENINLYAERDENMNIVLKVSQSSKVIIFENDTDVDSFELKDDDLKGNLLLFKTLIEETKSGELLIKHEDRKFKLILKLNYE